MQPSKTQLGPGPGTSVLGKFLDAVNNRSPKADGDWLEKRAIDLLAIKPFLDQIEHEELEQEVEALRNYAAFARKSAMEFGDQEGFMTMMVLESLNDYLENLAAKYASVTSSGTIKAPGHTKQNSISPRLGRAPSVTMIPHKASKNLEVQVELDGTVKSFPVPVTAKLADVQDRLKELFARKNPIFLQVSEKIDKVQFVDTEEQWNHVVQYMLNQKKKVVSFVGFVSPVDRKKRNSVVNKTGSLIKRKSNLQLPNLLKSVVAGVTGNSSSSSSGSASTSKGSSPASSSASSKAPSSARHSARDSEDLGVKSVSASVGLKLKEILSDLKLRFSKKASSQQGLLLLMRGKEVSDLALDLKGTDDGKQLNTDGEYMSSLGKAFHDASKFTGSDMDSDPVTSFVHKVLCEVTMRFLDEMPMNYSEDIIEHLRPSGGPGMPGVGAFWRDKPECGICGKKFTLTRSRFHCELCGLSVCDRCSPFGNFPGFDRKVRGCLKCTGKVGREDEEGVGVVLKPATAVTENLGRNLAKLTMDNSFLADTEAAGQARPTHIGTGLASGAKSLGKSVAQGVTGVFIDPYKGAKQDGAKGFIKGVGKGLAGVVVKPAVGVLSMATQTIKGAGNTAGYVKDRVTRKQRVRELGPPDSVNHGKKLMMIQAQMKQLLHADEKLVYHTANAGTTKAMMTTIGAQEIDDGLADCVLVTDKRLLHLADGTLVEDIFLESVVGSFHQTIGLGLDSDILVVKTQVGTKSIRVNDREACAFFNNVLLELVTEKRELTTPFSVKLNQNTVQMPEEVNHDVSNLKRIVTSLETEHVVTLEPKDDLLFHCVNLPRSHPKRANPGVRYTVSDCFLLTKRRLYMVDSGKVTVNVLRYKIVELVHSRSTGVLSKSRLALVMVDGRTIDIDIADDLVRNFVLTVLEEEIHDKHQLAFALNVETASEQRALSLHENSCFYIVCNFGGNHKEPLVVDFQPVMMPDGSDALPGEYELVLAPLSGQPSQRWVEIEPESGGPTELRPLLATKEHRGQGVPDWVLAQTWQANENGYIQLQGHELFLTIRGFCCGEPDCERGRLRAGNSLYMSPFKSHTEGKPSPSPMQLWRLATDFEIFLDDMVAPVMEALTDYSKNKSQREKRAADLAVKDEPGPEPEETTFFRRTWCSWAGAVPLSSAAAAAAAADPNALPPNLTPGTIPFAVWEPELPPGYVMFGHYLQVGITEPSRAALICPNNDAAFCHPMGYKEVWRYGKDDEEIRFWMPIPHNDNFVALGYVCTAGANAREHPDNKLVVCVDEEYLTEVEELQQFCTVEAAPGTKDEVSLWSLPQVGTFFLTKAVDGKHQSPPKPILRFVPTDHEFNAQLREVEQKGLDLLEESSKYLRSIVEDLMERSKQAPSSSSSSSGNNDEFDVQFRYQQIMELVEQTKNFLDVDAREKLIKDEALRARVEQSKSSIEDTCRLINRSINNRFANLKTLEDRAWEFHLTWKIISILPPPTWPEIVSWNFPLPGEEKDTEKVANQKMMERLVQNPPNPIPKSLKDVIWNLLSIQIVRKPVKMVKVEESEEMKAAKELAGLLEGVSAGAEEQVEKRYKFEDVLESLDKTLSQLKSVLKAIVMRSDHNTLDPGFAHLFATEFHNIIKPGFERYVDAKVLNVNQLITMVNWLQGYEHFLVKKLQVKDAIIMTDIHDMISLLITAYNEQSKKKVVGWVTNILKREFEAAPHLDDGSYFTHGPADLFENIDKAFTIAYEQHKLSGPVLNEVANMYAQILQYFQQNLKRALSPLQVTKENTLQDDKGEIVTLSNGAHVSHIWLAAQINNVSKYKTNTKEFQDLVFQVISRTSAEQNQDDDDAGLTLGEPPKAQTLANEELAKAQQQFDDVGTAAIDAYIKVARKYIRASLQPVFSTAWLTSQSSQKIFEDLINALGEVRLKLVHLIHDHAYRAKVAAAVINTLVSYYCAAFIERISTTLTAARVMSLSSSQLKETVFANIKKEREALKDLFSEEDYFDEVEVELKALDLVYDLYSTDPDFLSSLTVQALKTRFAGDKVVLLKKMVSTVLGLRDDLERSSRQELLALFPDDIDKGKQKDSEKVFWKLEIVIQGGSELYSAGRGQEPSPYCIVEVRGANGKALGKARTPAMKSTTAPIWDFVYREILSEFTTVHFELWNDKQLAPHEFLGECSVNLETILKVQVGGEEKRDTLNLALTKRADHTNEKVRGKLLVTTRCKETTRADGPEVDQWLSEQSRGRMGAVAAQILSHRPSMPTISLPSLPSLAQMKPGGPNTTSSDPSAAGVAAKKMFSAFKDKSSALKDKIKTELNQI